MMLFSFAAAMSALWFVVHLIWGGQGVATPLMADRNLPAVVRDTSYLCWHFVSVTLALMAAFFVIAAFSNQPGMGLAATMLAAGFTVVGVALPLFIGQKWSILPQGWLFLPITVLGAWEIWG